MSAYYNEQEVGVMSYGLKVYLDGMGPVGPFIARDEITITIKPGQMVQVSVEAKVDGKTIVVQKEFCRPDENALARIFVVGTAGI